jgi:hypothetical protein
MNRLPVAKRVQILSLLCEGSSMRSVSRLVDVSINTVTHELVLAGELDNLGQPSKVSAEEIKLRHYRRSGFLDIITGPMLYTDHRA